MAALCPLLVLTLCACGSASSGDAPVGSSSGDSTQVTFTEVYTTVLGTICVTCHTGAGAAGSLDMSSASAAYSNLVGVHAAGPACGSTDAVRVTAGHSSDSLLFEKVSGTQPCGSRMPLGGAPLSAADIALIGAWIDQGAKDD